MIYSREKTDFSLAARPAGWYIAVQLSKSGWAGRVSPAVGGDKTTTRLFSHMPRRPLTARQLQVYRYIACCVRQDGLPPTTRDLCREFGWASLNAAVQHVEALEAKGWLVRLPGLSRGIRLADGVCSLPYRGEVR